MNEATELEKPYDSKVKGRIESRFTLTLSWVASSTTKRRSRAWLFVQSIVILEYVELQLISVNSIGTVLGADKKDEKKFSGNE